MSDNIEEKQTFIGMYYKVKDYNKDKIGILGHIFVSNNKDKCKIIYKDKEYEIKEYFEDIDNNYNYKDDIVLGLKMNNNLIDYRYMFARCEFLVLFLDISQLKDSQLSNINEINYDNGQSLFDKENDNERNKEKENFYKDFEEDKYESLFSCDLSGMVKLSIKECIISSIDNKNDDLFHIYNSSSFLINSKSINLSYMFYECKALISLPDISKWNTENVKKMEKMFYGCSSLIILPDISKWNISKVKNISNMFGGCTSLISLPDISNWNVSDCEFMEGIFYKCTSLTTLPDLSNWNVSNFEDMSNLFGKCISLISLPDLSNWNVSNVEDMSNLFGKCISLISLPNLTKWKYKLSFKMNIFDTYQPLKSLIHLLKWKILIPNYGINIKFIKIPRDVKSPYIPIFQKEEELCGLLNHCLFKEIAGKLDDIQKKYLPKKLSYIYRILKESYTEEKIEEEEIKNTLYRVKGKSITNILRYIDKIYKKINLSLIEKLISLLKGKDLLYIKDIKRHFLNYNEYIKTFIKDFEIKKEKVYSNFQLYLWS